MDDREFDAIVREQQAEIDRQLDSPEDIELTCRELDDGCILSILRPTPGGRERKTFVISGYDANGDITHTWADDIATDLYFFYLKECMSWDNPTDDAVSPTLGEFFTYTHHEPPCWLLGRGGCASTMGPAMAVVQSTPRWRRSLSRQPLPSRSRMIALRTRCAVPSPGSRWVSTSRTN
jgi:hypothetical protein